MTMLDKDGNDQEYDGDDDEPELFFQTMLVVMMFVLVHSRALLAYPLPFVRATLAVMFMFMRMCHIFALFKFHGAKIRHIFCNLVANYL